MIVTESLLSTWFALQRQLIAGLRCGYVDLHGSAVPPGGLVVTYPDEVPQQTELALAAELARRSNAPVSSRLSVGADADASLRIAHPLRLAPYADGAVVVEVEAPLAQQAAVLQLLQWGEAWLKLALSQLDAPSSRPGLADVIAEGSTHTEGDDAVAAMLAMLPAHLNCTRVALAVADDGRVADLAISNVVEPDPRRERSRTLLAAMDAGLATGRTQSWWRADGVTDADAGPDAALRTFVTAAGLQGACIVPVSAGLPEPCVFAFEYAGERPRDAFAPSRCEDAARIVAPLIALRRERDRSWWQRCRSLLVDGWTAIAGPRRRLRHLLLLGAVLLAANFALGHSAYRVSGPAQLEGMSQRVVVAPFDGYVAEAHVRAGQSVSQGAILARLDDRDLRTEQRRLRGREDELARQHRQAVATLDHREAKILDAQLAQTRAQLASLDDQLARTELRAPFAGLVISGDWSRSLGAPVSRGDVLFEIAPLDNYRVAIDIDDRDIAQLAARQGGVLILSALPRHEIRLSVTGIATKATDTAGAPVFRVEAGLVGTLPQLRPGMEGIAKITVGQRRRWWIWSHELLDWLDLQLWRWLP